MKFFYICSECGRKFDISPYLLLCPICEQKQEKDKPLRGVLEVGFEGSVPSSSDPLDLLPVEKRYFPSIPVGNTPLSRPERLNQKYRFSHLYLKDDSLNPTGSLKDRASYLVAAFARKHGITRIVLASTGNAGSSMAGVGAAAGLEVTLFLPKSAPIAKLVQALQYGANLVRVDGNYDKAYDMSFAYSKTSGALSRNTGHNPLTIEGKKTAALEIFQQLGDCPDRVFVSVGDGVILGGLYKGFRDLKKLGFIETMPTIYAVQAEGSSAIARACQNKGEFDFPKRSQTVADSISVDIPRNGYYAVKQIQQYQGRWILVSDQEILNAQKELAGESGCFAEPAAAAAFAGFLKARDHLSSDNSVVIMITGNGLKDIETAKKAITIPKGD
jgi:threonine synthase